MVYNKTDWASHDVITTGKMNNIEDGIQTALNNSIFGHGGAEQPSEGTHVTNYIDLGDNFPKNALSGDVTYVRDGDDYKIYQYDGVSWVEQINPKFSQRLEKTMLEAKAQTETLISENQVNVDKTINEVKEEQKNLQDGLNNLDTNAQDYANKALADARADIATTAQDLTNKVKQETDDRVKAVGDATTHADSIVATAKSDLVNIIAKETSDRNAAVTDLDTKAKGYADIAKADAISAANGAVAKEVTDRQKAITDLDAKSTGAINQAKTDAQSALDALQVGGRNLLLNSKVLWLVSSNGGTITQETFDSTTNMWHITSPAGSGINKGIYFSIAKNTSMPIPLGQPWTMSFDIKGTGLFKQVGPENSTNKGLTGNVPTDWKRVSATGIRGTSTNIVLYFDTTDTVALDVYIKLPKLEIGNKATDYIQAPEDIVLDYTTKDNVISQSLTQYQTTNDGKVTKAQSDATQALGLVATKVSQTTFDTKTGDLDSKYTAVKQTADQASTDIVAIKSTNTSQDTKINTLTSDVSGTKQSISDIQTEQGKQSTKINTIQTDVSGTKQDISDIKYANGVQDGKIASISTTVDGLSSSFSTYKTTNDGKVAKAQADITANATAISQKVSQTAYDTKTGQLQIDLNTTTTTANQAKTDIVAIKKTDTDQDARMTTIESDANGVKTTVSSLQTTANTQAGSISTLQQRADGFDATVSTLGQINQLFNTEFTPDFAGWYAGISPSSGMYKTGNPLSSDISWSIGSGKYNGSTVLKHVYGSGNMAFFSDLIPVGEGVNITGSIVAMSTPEFTGSVSVAIYLRYYDSNKNYIGVQSADSGKWSAWTQKYIAQVTPTGAAYVSFNIQTNGNAGVTYYSQPMLTFSNKVGKYVQGNYNNNASVAKAQLTADQATTTINTYKTSNDGRVASAESKISQNATAITQKVSQTDYNQKTGQLQTDLNTTTNTANTAKQDIATIKTDNATRDSKINTLESDSTETKRTISKLSGDLNTVSGDVSTLKQTAQGFEATVTKVNNLSVGGRNLLSNSRGKFQPNIPRIDNYVVYTDSTVYMMQGQQYTVHADASSGLVWTDKHSTNVESNNVVLWIVGGNVNRIISDANTGTGTTFTWNYPSGIYYLRVNTYKSDNSGYVENVKVEKGNIATDWSPAPEDVDSSISSVKQTADSASTAITNYKTSNDGRVSAAEGAIKTNADAITQKVSQTDYNQKTGELSGKISEINQTTAGITQSVADVTTQVNNLQQVNLINNSDFRPDLSGWSIQSPSSGTVTTGDYDYAGNVMVLNNTAGGTLRVNSVPIKLTGATTVSYTFNYYIFGLSTGGAVYSQLTYLDSAMKEISGSYPGSVNLATTPVGSWQKRTVSNLGITPPTGATYIVFSFDVRGAGTKAGINRPILVKGGTVGDYVPGQYTNNDKISTVSQTVDSISSIVSDPTTGLTKRVQTAEGTLSQVTGADIPNLQKATFWQAPNGYDLNTYLTQGSFFFNNTNARTNNPKADNGWMYLVVEQANGGSRVTQTAWYDSVASAKVTYKRQYVSGTWSPWYANDNDSVTSIAQTNGAIQQEVKDRTNGDSNTLTQAKNFTTSSITSSETGMKSLITQTSDSIVAQIGNTNLITNSEFDPDNAGWYDIPAVGTTIGSPVKTPISKYFKDVVNNSKGLAFGNGSGTWYTSEPVPIAPGTKISMSMFAGRAFASTTATTMDFRIGRWDANKKFITSSFGPNPINGTTPVPIKTYKVENITVPADTYYISMVFGHSGSGAGVEDSIYHPMINVGEKAFAYSPTYGTTSSATQLALMKDNWSIGIADNTGKLASGVFGTIDGMNLVGNKMTINANQTTITGTTWIQTGMIGQGIIGSAQISQLDVNKLVGNTSNFVKSAWDSAYGSTVTIDGNGMAIRAGGNNGFYTRLQSGKLQFESLYSDATLPGGVRHEVIGSVFGGSDAQVGGDVDALSFTLFDQTFPSFTDGHPVGSPKDGSGYIWGGDKITWNVADTQAGHVRELFGWYNATASNVQGISRGFNFFDRVNFNGSEIEISGAQNNLIFTWAQWNGYFSNEKSPAIAAANGSWRGGGIAFGNNSVVVYNAATGVNKILM